MKPHSWFIRQWYILAIFLCAAISFVYAHTEQEEVSKPHQQRSKRKTDRLTAYACEDSTLNITCGQNLYLDVIRANYGRFSITICNDHGNTDWKVDCQAGRTLRVMQARCSNQHDCIVPVQTSIFGDPCPGTFKYIEVHYACRKEPVLPETTSTARFPPVWVPPYSPRPADIDIWSSSTAKPMLTTLDPEDYEDESLPESDDIPGLDNDYERVIQVKVPKVPVNYEGRQQSNKHLPTLPEDSSSDAGPDSQIDNIMVGHQDHVVIPTKRPSVSLQVLANFTQYCPPARSRNLFWNWTLAGDTAVVQCPSGATGFAKWKCDSAEDKKEFYQRSNTAWSPKGPSLAECRSLWLGELDSKLRGGDISVANVSHILAKKTSALQAGETVVLFGGDLVLGARMLKHMAERMHYDLQRTGNLETREAMVTNLVQNVVKTTSNLVEDSSSIRQSWSDLRPDELGRAITALLIGLEENAFLLAETVTTEKIIIKPTRNVLLSIRVMQSRNAHRQIFPYSETIESWNSSGDSIILSPEAIRQNGNNGAVRVIFTAFNQLDQLLIPIKTSPPSRWQTMGKEEKKFINSRIIAASLGRGRHIELPKPVEITFKHLNEVDPARVRPQCVYWDYVSNAWSEDGCHAVMSNITHTQCSCNHLTNFALLMSHSTDHIAPSSNSLVPKSQASSKTTKSSSFSTHMIHTTVASVSALILVIGIIFFIVMAWKRFKVSSQCRLALENSGLPCFHKGKELPGGNSDGNKGNFYTVTPKLNAPGSGQANGNENVDEVTDAQQFFEHIVNLQKNEQNNARTMRRSNSHNINGEDQEISKNNLEQQKVLNKLKTNQTNNGEILYPKRTNYARALSPYNHIYMEIDDQTMTNSATANNAEAIGGPVYEPLTHSETYLMSTMSDMSEDNYNYLNGINSDVSRQSSSRETRPLIRSFHGNGGGSTNNTAQNTEPRANLLQTISGVLHSQSVRITPSGNNSFKASATLHPIRRNLSNPPLPHHHATLARMEMPLNVSTVNGNEFVRLNLSDAVNGQNPDSSATYIASTTSDLGVGGQSSAGHQQMTNAYLGKHHQFLRASGHANGQHLFTSAQNGHAAAQNGQVMQMQPVPTTTSQLPSYEYHNNDC